MKDAAGTALKKHGDAIKRRINKKDKKKSEPEETEEKASEEVDEKK